MKNRISKEERKEKTRKNGRMGKKKERGEERKEKGTERRKFKKMN